MKAYSLNAYPESLAAAALPARSTIGLDPTAHGLAPAGAAIPDEQHQMIR